MSQNNNINNTNSIQENQNMRNNTGALSNTNPENELINKYPMDREMNTIVYVESGQMVLKDCLLSLSFIVKSHKNILPALVCVDHTQLILDNCEIKGNQQH